MDDIPEVDKITIRIEYASGRVLEIGAEYPLAASIDHGEPTAGGTMIYSGYFELPLGTLPDLTNTAPDLPT